MIFVLLALTNYAFTVESFSQAATSIEGLWGPDLGRTAIAIDFDETIVAAYDQIAFDPCEIRKRFLKEEVDRLRMDGVLLDNIPWINKSDTLRAIQKWKKQGATVEVLTMNQLFCPHNKQHFSPEALETVQQALGIPVRSFLLKAGKEPNYNVKAQYIYNHWKDDYDNFVLIDDNLSVLQPFRDIMHPQRTEKSSLTLQMRWSPYCLIYEYPYHYPTIGEMFSNARASHSLGSHSMGMIFSLWDRISKARQQQAKKKQELSSSEDELPSGVV